MAQSQTRGTAEYLTVSQFIRQTVSVLESALGVVYLQGEVGELKKPPSGHIYLTLKDDKSQLSLVIWNSTAKQLEKLPEQGMKILCRGRPTIYAGQGRFQLTVDWLVPSGEGELQRRFLELKAKLEAEGLFAAERKRPLPFLPKVVGVVTSAGGAVIHDIMVRVRERMPCLKVELYDARVQGNGAADEIAAGVRWFNANSTAEVIIVARGGGLLEDLWSFNEEVVVRAVFASRIPVVSGVGHEVDITLSDLVADVRAPTPTAAAEMVVPHRRELWQRVRESVRRLRDTERWFLPYTERVDDYALRLHERLEQRIHSAGLILDAAVARLEKLRPERVIGELRSRLERMCLVLRQSAAKHLAERDRRVSHLQLELRTVSPEGNLRRYRERLLDEERRLRINLVSELRTKRQHWVGLNSRLAAANPAGLLRRGYAIVERSGRIIPSAAQLDAGDAVQIRFHDGKVKTIVEEKEVADGTEREARLG